MVITTNYIQILLLFNLSLDLFMTLQVQRGFWAMNDHHHLLVLTLLYSLAIECFQQVFFQVSVCFVTSKLKHSQMKPMSSPKKILTKETEITI